MSQAQPNYQEIAIGVYKRIQSSFPHLSMEIDENPTNRYIDVEMEIPKQPGLSFDIGLNLQHDELNLGSSSFWFEWFPCVDDARLDEYLDAVTGLIAGRFRLQETLRGKKVVRSRLQAPEGDGWKTIASCSGLHLSFFRKKSIRIIQNQEVGCHDSPSPAQ